MPYNKIESDWKNSRLAPRPARSWEDYGPSYVDEEAERKLSPKQIKQGYLKRIEELKNLAQIKSGAKMDDFLNKAFDADKMILGEMTKETSLVEKYSAILDDALGPPKPRRRSRLLRKKDRVNTPQGPGNIWCIDRDGTVCVELDSDPSILHEFEKNEIEKIKDK